MTTEILIALCVIWGGIAFLILRIDRRLAKLERKLDEE